jgi:hypothetical protein
MNYEPFIERGWAVFPLRANTKKPACKNGCLQATRSPEDLKKLFREGAEYNVGIATGSKSGVFVVDLDLKAPDEEGKGGADGLTEFEKLVSERGAMPDTLMVRTPRGGVHLYFQMPGDGAKVPSGVNVMGPGIDVRGDGGYVVAPGSVVFGNTYTIECDAPPAPAPWWILDKARKPDTRQRVKDSTTRKSVDSAWVESALRAVSADCDYKVWVEIGMALHDWDDHEGLALWEAWSQTGGTKYQPGDCERKWDSFHEGGGIGLQTLFFYARRERWSPPVADGIKEHILKVVLGRDNPYQKDLDVTKAVVETLGKTGRLYYNEEIRDCSTCMYFDSSRKQLEPIQGDPFLTWLARLTGVSRGAGLWKHISKGVEDAALSGPDSTGVIPAHYWEMRGDTIYLSNGDGAMVKITKDGLERVDNGTDGVLFAAGKTLAPWDENAEPKDAFDTCRVFRDFHSEDPHAKPIFKAWAYSVATGAKTKPVLCSTGLIQSGKTRALKSVLELYGVGMNILNAKDMKLDNLWVCMDAGGIVVVDNVDTDIRGLADTLASASTGATDQRRKLYKDNVIVSMKPRAWVAVTSANPTFARDAGLADRLQVVPMARRDGESADSELSQEVLANRDSGLAFIAWTLSKALAEPPESKTPNRRHPDYSRFALRIGKALGSGPEFEAALVAAESTKTDICVDNDTTASSLLDVLTNKPAGRFEGTLEELLQEMSMFGGKELENVSVRALGKRLQAIYPHLESRMEVWEKKRTNSAARYHLKLTKAELERRRSDEATA